MHVYKRGELGALATSLVCIWRGICIYPYLHAPAFIIVLDLVEVRSDPGIPRASVVAEEVL
jgi:hypothetical protein